LNLKHSEMVLTADAMAALQRYSWPGNIRELRNVLERAALLADDAMIKPRHLHFEFESEGHQASAAPSALGNTKLTLSDMERIYIEKIIQEENGRIERAAQRLGVPRSSLYKMIKAMGINVSKGPVPTL